MIASVAALLGAALVAQGCDDITARSFGGNVAGPGGATGALPDGGLARGHGGTTAISVATGGAEGRTPAGGSAGASQPASTGGAGAAPATSQPSTPTSGAGGTPVSGTGGVMTVIPAGSGGAVGAVATGGTLGAGATLGSGGMVPANPSTGGLSTTTGTGGMPAVTGSGGGSAATGTGGKGGAGGSPKTGGSAGAGPAAPGAGGGTQNQNDNSDEDAQKGPDSCAKLIADYDDAVTKGKSCDAKSKGASSCAKTVPAELSGCGASCNTFVDDDGMVNMVRQKWMKAGCVAASCALEVCVSPTAASCASDGHDDKGTCTDSLLGL